LISVAITGIMQPNGGNVMSQVLTVEEVAAQLKVNAKTVYRMLRKGKLCGVKAGRLWRVPEKAFEEFLEGKQEEYDNDSLSPEEKALIEESDEAIRKGDFVTLEDYEKERGL
jgi:excisionase family DNA binding protein